MNQNTYQPPDAFEMEDQGEQQQNQAKQIKQKKTKRQSSRQAEEGYDMEDQRPGGGSKEHYKDDREYDRYHKDLISNKMYNEKYDLSKAAHPQICILTFVFKALQITTYMIFGWFLSDIIVFILVIVFGALDFYSVKNITGRILVGLRWWSKLESDGTEVWIFESRNDDKIQMNKVDQAFFWTSQMALCITWATFLVLNVLSFTFYWTILNIIAFGMGFANLYGFYKCRKEHQQKLLEMESYIKNVGFKKMANVVINNKFQTKK